MLPSRHRTSILFSAKIVDLWRRLKVTRGLLAGSASDPQDRAMPVKIYRNDELVLPTPLAEKP